MIEALKLIETDESLLSVADRVVAELDMTCIIHGQVVDHAFGECICTEENASELSKNHKA